jgi:hypothetical protein
LLLYFSTEEREFELVFKRRDAAVLACKTMSLFAVFVQQRRRVLLVFQKIAASIKQKIEKGKRRDFL